MAPKIDLVGVAGLGGHPTVASALTSAPEGSTEPTSAARGRKNVVPLPPPQNPCRRKRADATADPTEPAVCCCQDSTLSIWTPLLAKMG